MARSCYFDPDPDGNGTIWESTPGRNPLGRVFICECCAEDAGWLMAAIVRHWLEKELGL